MKRLIPLLLLLPCFSFAQDYTFFRAHDANSVVLGPICMMDVADDDCVAVPFGFTSLTITIGTQAAGVYTVFNYTGGNIDDAPASGWGNPAASAIEVHDVSTGALTASYLHLRDEVLASAGSTEWTIVISDGGSVIRDTIVQVLAISTSADNQSDITAALASYDAPTNSELDARTILAANYSTATNLQTVDDNVDTVLANVGSILTSVDTDGVELSTTAVQAIWDLNCEDQNGGITCQEAMSIMLAENIGTCVYTASTLTWVCKDPSNTETRFTLVYGTELDGDRTTSTPAPMTP